MLELLLISLLSLINGISCPVVLVVLRHLATMRLQYVIVVARVVVVAAAVVVVVALM